MNNGFLNSFPRGLGDLLLWLVPIGTGHDFWGPESATPRGYISGAGGTQLISKYPKLWKLWGTTYGGDGITTFGVPDKRGRVSIGKDNMGGAAANRVTAGVSGITATTLGAVGGDERSQAHGHTASQGTHAHNVTLWGDSQGGGVNAAFTSAANGGLDTVAGADGTLSLPNTGFTDAQSSGAITVDPAGSGGSQNMIPGIVCNYIIRAG